MKKFFTKYYWEDLYYNIKHGIRNIFIYLPLVWKMRDWDYHYVLEMNKFQLKRLHDSIKNGHEVDEGRIPKEEDILRCIELIDNILEDNYMERCGFDYDRIEIDFVDVEDDPDLKKMINKHPNPQSDEEVTEIIKQANKLQKKELKELYSIMEKNILTWWD